MNLYSVYDIVSDSFNTVFCCKSDAVAIRDFSTLRGNDTVPIEDLQLFRLATFDETTGAIVPDKSIIKKGRDYIVQN